MAVSLVSLVLAAPAVRVGAQAEVTVWLPGPGATGNNTYTGYLEQPSLGEVASGQPLVVSGWLVDTTAQGWAGFDQLQLYNGQMDSGGTKLADGQVGQNRPDVAAATGNPSWQASGFQAEVSPSQLQSGTALVFVYAHTPSKGWWYTSVPVTISSSAATTTSARATGAGPPQVSIDRPRSNETIATTRTSSGASPSYTMSGSVVDPAETRATGPGIDRVEVYLNGARGDPRAAFLGDATITGTEWSLTFSPDSYPWGSVPVFVYAHSRLTGEETLVIQQVSIV